MALRVRQTGSFADSLKAYLDEFADSFSLRTELRCDGDFPRLQPRAEAELLQIDPGGIGQCSAARRCHPHPGRCWYPPRSTAADRRRQRPWFRANVDTGGGIRPCGHARARGVLAAAGGSRSAQGRETISVAYRCGGDVERPGGRLRSAAMTISPKPVRVMLLDDPLVRAGVRYALTSDDIKMVAERPAAEGTSSWRWRPARRHPGRHQPARVDRGRPRQRPRTAPADDQDRHADRVRSRLGRH